MGFVIIGGKGVFGRRDDFRLTIENFLEDNGFEPSEKDGSYLMSQRDFFQQVHDKIKSQKGVFSFIEEGFSEEKFYSYWDYLNSSNGNLSLEENGYSHVKDLPLGISRFTYNCNNGIYSGEKAKYFSTEVTLPDEYNIFSRSNELYIGIFEAETLNKDSKKIFYKELSDRLKSNFSENNEIFINKNTY